MLGRHVHGRWLRLLQLLRMLWLLRLLRLLRRLHHVYRPTGTCICDRLRWGPKGHVYQDRWLAMATICACRRMCYHGLHGHLRDRTLQHDWNGRAIRRLGQYLRYRRGYG